MQRVKNLVNYMDSVDVVIGIALFSVSLSSVVIVFGRILNVFN
jgi:hypothetical protein